MSRRLRLPLRRILQFVAGLIAGTLLWMWLAEPYNVLLARLTQPLVHIDARLRDAQLVARGDRIDVVSSTGTLPPGNIPAVQLTFNVILLIALFASNKRPFSDRNARAFALSLLVVLLLHPVGAWIAVESTYATRAGEWSDAHYGAASSSIWLMAELFWRLTGMFGVAFGCWWVSGEH